MRLSHREANYADVIAFANQSFATATEQAQFDYNGNSTISPFNKFDSDRDYLGASLSLHNKLEGMGDPRDTIFWETHEDADEFLYAPNGTANEAQGLYAVSAISTPTAPTYLMSYHELEFLKAEAYVRQNNLDSAATSLEKAISAAFQKENIGLTADDAATYFEDNVLPRFNSNPLAEVITQKYIAFFEEEAIEAYN